MGAFSFFLRTMILTVLLIMVMQVRWDNTTIEDHVMTFLTSSAVVKPLNETAKGAVIFVRNTWSKTTKAINTNFSRAMHSDNQPGSRRITLFDRTEKAASAGVDTVRTAARDVVDDAKDFDAHATFEKLREKAVTTTRHIRGKFIDETKTPKDPTGSSDGDSENMSKTRVKTQPNEEGSVLDNGDE